MGSHICPDCGGQVVAAPGVRHDCPVRERQRYEAAVAGWISDVDTAIATIEDSRSTHVNWRDKLAAGLEEPHESIGDVAWHQACIDGYDQVLSVLRRVAP